MEQPQRATKPLAGEYAGFHRLRIGDIRVIIEYQLMHIVIYVYKVGWRKNVYS
jgi:mRNA-degrading endonuclease RelE of RelBE toxin-antitoxin system